MFRKLLVGIIIIVLTYNYSPYMSAILFKPSPVKYVSKLHQEPTLTWEAWKNN